MIIIRDLTLNLGPRKLFDQINISFQADQKVGVVGRNGAGKSTLLKAISGEQTIDDGLISLDGNKRLAYMPQDLTFESQKTVYDEALTVFDDFLKAKQELELLEEELAAGADDAEKKLDRLHKLNEKLVLFDFADAQKRTKDILAGLGFSDQQLTQSVSSLSVGWKMRVLLAKLLLQQADFYLFDEPTNHLDLATKEWFLNFLKNGNFGFLLVTHDRHFLEKACDKIFEIERGHGHLYHGNFSHYISQKEQNLTVQQAAYERQQKEITQKKKTIERFRASASKAKMAQSMIKQLERMDLVEVEPPLPTVSFSFPSTVRPGKVVLKVENVTFGYDPNKPLFKNASCEIMRGQKVALVAPNGVGKTTLFNLITGALPLQSGSIEFGHNVHSALFEQDQARVLNPKNTIIEEVSEHCSKVPDGEIRSMLGNFLFSGEDVDKKIAVLSGGERNRVAMCKVLLQKANLLLLDEPTNHLDLYAKEVLAQALKQYDGAMLFVSHDHAFIKQLATAILELTPNGLYYYPGSYEEFLADTKRVSSPVSSKNAFSGKQAELLAPEGENKELRKLESKIGRLEHEKAKILSKLEQVEYASPEYQKLVKKLSKIDQDLEEYMQLWEGFL